MLTKLYINFKKLKKIYVIKSYMLGCNKCYEDKQGG